MSSQLRGGVVSRSSELTRQRILEAASEEFQARGFQEASMRRIAHVAEATTGAIYHYFPSKELLFDALVHEPTEQLFELWVTLHESPETNAFEAHDRSADCTAAVLTFVYDHIDAFRLVFCHAAGTKYEDYPERLIAVEEVIYRLLPGLDNSPADELFLRTVAASDIEALRKAVEHGLSRKEAHKYMNKTREFRLNGWSALAAA